MTSDYGQDPSYGEPTPTEDCRDWTAIHDLQPPGPAVLAVVGTCTVPTPGHRVELRRHEPQGFNPQDLLLDRVVIEPTDPVAQVITEVEVRYTDETDFNYDTVTILPDGETVAVERAF